MPASPMPDLEGLRALLEKMSPGPWLHSALRNCVDTAQLDKNGDRHDWYSFGLSDEDRLDGDYLLPWSHDARGIVALRNSADTLLSTISTLTARVGELEAGLREALNTLGHHDECGWMYALRKYNRGIRWAPASDGDCTCGIARLRALAGGAAARTTETPGGKP